MLHGGCDEVFEGFTVLVDLVLEDIDDFFDGNNAAEEMAVLLALGEAEDDLVLDSGVAVWEVVPAELLEDALVDLDEFNLITDALDGVQDILFQEIFIVFTNFFPVVFYYNFQLCECVEFYVIFNLWFLLMSDC